MNAVEIEEAVSALADAPFDGRELPFQFLAAFGNKDTTIKRLRSGASNASDVTGGVLQRGNIHIVVCAEGEAGHALTALRDSTKTASAKAKFILATDGVVLEAEDLGSGETLACPYPEFADHFGFFLPLAGISTVREIKNNPIDIKATGRLNKLYVELLRDNPDWATEARRPALNRLMARLIFCFFAEDTGIFHGSYQFTPTVERMSESLSGNTHEVIGELFRTMGTPTHHAGQLDNRYRAAARIKNWAQGFPFVNGGLFEGDGECPRFSRLARSYLLAAGRLNWKEINPDIFGSMIQAVADDDERGELGMHYTSVPNILKVLNPLFLDSLREQLEAAGENSRKLKNLRKRLASIRVFDPACGSGNFLVIAYKEMRAIEAEIVRRLGGEASLKLDDRRSVIPLANFYGIEIKSFAAEIARLALLIAEFQADCVYLSQQEARAMVLPLHRTGQVAVGNALRVDWLAVCPPVTKAIVAEHDLGGPTGRLALEENGLSDGREPETYICGNPPYVGDKKQSALQKSDMENVFAAVSKRWRSFDYIGGFFYNAAVYVSQVRHARAAFVSTNSISQGTQASEFWPLALTNARIFYAHLSFKWQNLAANNAGVTCVVVGLCDPNEAVSNRIFDDGSVRRVDAISPYLIPGEPVFVRARSSPISGISEMLLGNFAKDDGHLIASQDQLKSVDDIAASFARPMFGGQEFIKGIDRYCFWISEEELNRAYQSPELSRRFRKVSEARLASPKAATAAWSDRPFRFVEIRSPAYRQAMIVPIVSSESRNYLPVGLLPPNSIVNYAFGLYDAPLWNMALIASRLHLVWIATVCGKMKTDFRYSNTLGWNTFPVPKLTEQDKADLTRCAENILLAREAHFPKTIADLYDPEEMPENLRHAHEANDETLERIYIGRKFRNDTERLEKQFELYTKMIAEQPAAKKGKKAA